MASEKKKTDSIFDDFIITHKKLTACIILFFVFLWVQPYRITVIDSGEIGIKFHKFATSDIGKGELEQTVRGWIIYNRYTTDIFRYPTYIQRKNYEPFTVTCKDASIFTMDPQIAYRIDTNRACDIFRKYRRGIRSLENGYIKTCIYNAYRLCANRYNSDYLMSHRAEFENDVISLLQNSLEHEGFIVEEFTSAITPPQSLSKTIEEKNAAVQAALKAENQVKEAEANAKIKIAKAKGDAEATKINADAEAYYNKKIAESMTEALIKKMFIEKWDGVMPRTTAGNNMMMLLDDNKNIT